jgi:hypothetical protein
LQLKKSRLAQGVEVASGTATEGYSFWHVDINTFAGEEDQRERLKGLSL